MTDASEGEVAFVAGVGEVRHRTGSCLLEGLLRLLERLRLLESLLGCGSHVALGYFVG